MKTTETTIAKVITPTVEGSTKQLPPPQKKKRDYILNTDQQRFVFEFLEWLEIGNDRLKVLDARAGVGKTFTLKHAIERATKLGLIPGAIHIAAPTHQAVGIVGNALKGVKFDSVSTAHALLKLRPQEIEWTIEDDATLERLYLISPDVRTSDETALMDFLILKQSKSASGKKEFTTQGELDHLKNARLIVVDEGGMLNSYIFGLLCELIEDQTAELHPECQVLFLGDSWQLAPIGEALAKCFSLPHFSPMTKIERYSGMILEYVTRLDPDPAIGDPDWKTLHRRIKPSDPEDESLLCLESHEIMTPEALKQVYSAHSVRFLARTNKKVWELNYYIRSLLVGKKDGKVFYQPGDQILTLDPIAHGLSPHYELEASSRGDLEIGTSTLIELGEELSVGDWVQYSFDGEKAKVRLRESSFSFKAATGVTYTRQFYRYRLAHTNKEFSRNTAICLISPNQFIQWKADCDKLMDRYRVTQSKGKTTKAMRGQAGAYAAAVWKEKGLKNWSKWLDGTPVSTAEYNQIKKDLRMDAWNLVNFADNANFSYCSTVNRVQGITVDVVVIDIKNILDEGFMQYAKQSIENKYDPRKALYTGSTRASQQIVFMD